jgi:hypothetical protein
MIWGHPGMPVDRVVNLFARVICFMAQAGHVKFQRLPEESIA